MAMLVGCSGKSEEDIGCAGYCYRVVACAGSWASESRGELNCTWKYGDAEAHDSCMMSCERNEAELEMGSTAEHRECLECVVEEVGLECADLREASERCPCEFEYRQLGTRATPRFEPMVCDSGDVYVFAADNESGALFRERCLERPEVQFCD
jgi:hypothetical protein